MRGQLRFQVEICQRLRRSIALIFPFFGFGEPGLANYCSFSPFGERETLDPDLAS